MAGGWSAFGNVFKPCTCPCGSPVANRLNAFGIEMAQSFFCWVLSGQLSRFQAAPWSVSFVVQCASMAAAFAGWFANTSRPLLCPKNIWIGATNISPMTASLKDLRKKSGCRSCKIYQADKPPITNRLVARQANHICKTPQGMFLLKMAAK